MKQKYFLQLILLTFSLNSFSQVSVSISQMTTNNGSLISNCGNIAFCTNSTVTIDFTINLSKAANQVVGKANFLFIQQVLWEQGLKEKDI